MKKVLLYLLVMTFSLFADYYPSVHQISASGKIGVVDQMKYIASINGKYPAGFNSSFVITNHARDDASGNFCVDGWSKMKIYVPAGATYLQFSLSTKTNTNYIAHLKFKAQVNTINHVNTIDQNLNNLITQSTTSWPISDVGQIVLYENDITKLVGSTGGWLYIDVAGDTYHRISSFFNNYNATIYLSYYLKIANQAAFDNWLKTTYFQSNGDPIEDSSTMNIINNSCTSGLQTSVISLSQAGSLYDGSSTYQPVPTKTAEELCTEAGKYWDSISSTCMTDTVKACVIDNGGIWSTTENRCITVEETNCNSDTTKKWYITGNTCLEKEKSINAILKDGYWQIPEFYANSEGWSTDISIRNLNTNSSVIKVTTIEVLDSNEMTKSLSRIEVQNADTTWYAKIYDESSKVYLEDNSTSPRKTEVTPTINSGVINVYTNNGEDISELQVDATVKYDIATYTPVVVSTTDKSAEQAECEAAGNTWSDEINQCLSTSTPVVTQTDSQKQAECEARGSSYTWNSSASLCMYTPPTTAVVTQTDSQKQAECEARGSSYTWNSSASLCMYVQPATQSDKSVEQTECEAAGNTWSSEINQCMSSTKATDDSPFGGDDEASTEEQLRAETSSALQSQTFDIAGYFVHYDSGSFDWAYVNSSGSLIARLTGIDSNGNLTWEILRYQDVELLSGATFDTEHTQVTFGDEYSVPGRSSATANKLANKTFNTTGVFVHYGSGSYDWTYLNFSAQVAAKLTGLDEATGNLTWLWLEGNSVDLFNSVELINDNTQVTFGQAN